MLSNCSLLEVWEHGKTQISESKFLRRMRQEKDIVSMCQRLTMSQWEHNFRTDRRRYIVLRIATLTPNWLIDGSFYSSVQPSTSVLRATSTSSKASLLPIATSTTLEGPVVNDGPVRLNKKRRLDRTDSENGKSSSLQHEREHGPGPKKRGRTFHDRMNSAARR